MKGLFIVFEALYDHSGISMKIKSQVEGFVQNGVDMALCSLVSEMGHPIRYSGRVVDGEVIEHFSKITRINQLERILRYNKLYQYIMDHQIELVYIRYVHTASPFFNRFLKKLKHRGVIVLMEIPTYPYDSEYKQVSFQQKVLLAIEKVYRLRFKYYLCNIITFSDDEMIFGVPTIQISNGVDLDRIKIVDTVTVGKEDDLHLIGVASLSFWHGFDRLIRGLHHYYASQPCRKVVFHIVGDENSPEGIKYQQLVEQYQLQDYVVMHGKQFGPALDKIFDQCQLGIGCLGVHRKGINYSRSLKNREYCARGVPFMYAEVDDYFDDKAFVLKVAADESVIDLAEVIAFIDQLPIDHHDIRAYAEAYLSWEVQMKKVIEQAGMQVLQ